MNHQIIVVVDFRRGNVRDFRRGNVRGKTTRTSTAEPPAPLEPLPCIVPKAHDVVIAHRSPSLQTLSLTVPFLTESVTTLATTSPRVSSRKKGT